MCTHTTSIAGSEGILPSPVVPVTRMAPAVTTPTRVLKLAQHESIRIVDSSGRPLLDILSGEHGPVLQLAQSDTQLDVAGQLRIYADAIEMIARDGELKMLAKDDVVVRGEKVRLN